MREEQKNAAEERAISPAPAAEVPAADAGETAPAQGAENAARPRANKRGSFTGKLGFVLAAAGSAVGLGNIWRFPYLAAKYGGGIFLLTYLVLAVTFGFVLMTAEIALGRKTGKSAVGAFRFFGKKFAFIGILCAVVPVIILPYYSVIGGWVIKYFEGYVTGAGGAMAGADYFDSFVSSTWQPLLFFFVFVTATFAVVLFGVEKGVEKVSKILMPLLVVLTIGITVYILTTPGALDGVKYYLIPNFKNFSVKTVLAALGQLFYSMSLAMGIMITYGSYMKKDVKIESSVHHIELFDTGIAFLAGLMIVPAAVAFSGDPSNMNKGPGLMFVTLPQVFDRFGSVAGGIAGAVFFAMVFVAALTSSISLMETVASIVMDKFGLTRKKAVCLTYGWTLLAGIPSSLGFGVLGGISIGGMTILDMFDFISNSVLMPVVAFFTCLFIGYVIGCKQITDEIELNGRFRRKKMFNAMIKYIAPVFLVVILVTSVLDVLGVFVI